jgi:hypothetical protein
MDPCCPVRGQGTRSNRKLVVGWKRKGNETHYERALPGYSLCVEL